MYKGQLTGFPTEIVEKMLEYQIKQENPRNVSVFENDLWADKNFGGFCWSVTLEGYDFWYSVLACQQFDVFFDKYPKPTIQTYINFMTANKINMLVWEWSECPLEEKWSLGHGGDEDYVILFKAGDWMTQHAVDRLTVCDRYSAEYGEYELTVTAHA